MRKAKISRKIFDGKGIAQIETGIGFFDHMLTALSVHSGISISLKCIGDLNVDCHHSVEDTGIVLGQAFNEALKDKSGIERYGSAYIPMDEALGFCSLDISMIGEYDTCMTEEFFRAFAFNAGITLHVNMVYGTNDHHKCEAIFKACAHALKKAIRLNETGETLSTKGSL